MWPGPSDVGAPDPGWTSREPDLMKRIPFFLPLEFQIEGFLASCCGRWCPGPQLGQPVQKAQLGSPNDVNAQTSANFSCQPPNQVPGLPTSSAAQVLCPRFRKDLYESGEVRRYVAPRTRNQAPSVEAAQISEAGD